MKASTHQLLELEKLKAEVSLKEGLPHLHGKKFYKWAREFFESRSRFNILCAGNQIGKSSFMIRKCVHWATARHLWSELWSSPPRVFLYLYPTIDVATTEFEKKWVPEILPANEYRESEEFGWGEEYSDKGSIAAVNFKNGVSILFKSYAQSVSHLQTVSASAVFCDEELPEDLFPELRFRLAGTHGYFCSAFTATLGQEFWRQMVEEEPEKRPIQTARVWQVSMYDCLRYEDGSNSHWTVERIREEEAACPTESEVLKRVYGRFVKSDDLRYPSFERKRNFRVPNGPPPSDWYRYSGVDIGSGVGRGHPSAIAFVAIRPDFRFGRVYRGWRGNNELTTAGDVFIRYLNMRGSERCVAQYYDHACLDFHTISCRNGEAFNPADKRREYGDGLLNTLFKHGMLVIDDIPELYPLVVELENLGKGVAKQTAKDDFIDSVRYAVSSIPWDMGALLSGIDQVMAKALAHNPGGDRRSFALGLADNTLQDDEIEGEIAFWQSYIDA